MCSPFSRSILNETLTEVCYSALHYNNALHCTGYSGVSMFALIDAYRAGLLQRPHWFRNIVAGLIVGVVALPLAMAFAIASGVKPEQGIYTAIIAGIIVSLFGGSRVQIAGPTGAFIVILAAVVAQHGVDG